MTSAQAAVAVDLDGVRAFADLVTRMTADGIQADVGRTQAAVQTGVRFGHRHASGHVQVARDAVAELLLRARYNTEQQVRAATVLAAAAREIAEAYAAADRGRAVDVNRVAELVGAASTAVAALDVLPGHGVQAR